MKTKHSLDDLNSKFFYTDPVNDNDTDQNNNKAAYQDKDQRVYKNHAGITKTETCENGLSPGCRKNKDNSKTKKQEPLELVRTGTRKVLSPIIQNNNNSPSKDSRPFQAGIPTPQNHKSRNSTRRRRIRVKNNRNNRRKNISNLLATQCPVCPTMQTLNTLTKEKCIQIVSNELNEISNLLQNFGQ